MLDGIERLWELAKKHPGRAVIFAALIGAIYPVKVYIDAYVPKAVEDAASEPAVVDAAPQPPSSPQSVAQSSEESPQCGGTIIIDSLGPRERIAVQMQELLSVDYKNVSTEKVAVNSWDRITDSVGEQEPCAIIAHWHTLRDELQKIMSKTEAYRESEERLLDGLGRIRKRSPRVGFVIYSSSFSPGQNLEPASSRLKDTATTQRLGDYSDVLVNAWLLNWDDAYNAQKPPTSAAVGDLQSALNKALKVVHPPQTP